LQWQELSVFKFKPGQIHQLSVVSDHEFSVTRGAKDEWTRVTGTGAIDEINIQSLVNTLSNLRAVRWLGQTTPVHALEKPQLALTFTTSPDDKQLHKLLIGGQTAEGMWFAKTDERQGTFVLSNPDVSAFRLPLIKAELPTASATTGPSSTATPAGSP
jgi:hypothetical protein